MLPRAGQTLKYKKKSVRARTAVFLVGPIRARTAGFEPERRSREPERRPCEPERRQNRARAAAIRARAVDFRARTASEPERQELQGVIANMQ